MLSTIESADLAWVWKADPEDLISVLLLIDRGQTLPVDRLELRELALRLLLQSPAGMPTSFAELIEATAPHRLAERWGGVYDRGEVWAGVRGADHLIAAVVDGKVLPGLLAELTNLFHHWAVTGRTSL